MMKIPIKVTPLLSKIDKRKQLSLEGKLILVQVNLFFSKEEYTSVCFFHNLMIWQWQYEFYFCLVTVNLRRDYVSDLVLPILL